MSNLSWWKKAYAVFALCAATAVAAYNANVATASTGKKALNGATIPTLTLPSNYALGKPIITQDLRVTKEIRFKERYKFLVFGEFFNVLNHPNFDQPVNNLSNAGQFGRIIATVSPPTSVLGSGLGGDSSPRQIQLIAKFIF